MCYVISSSFSIDLIPFFSMFRHKFNGISLIGEQQFLLSTKLFILLTFLLIPSAWPVSKVKMPIFIHWTVNVFQFFEMAIQTYFEHKKRQKKSGKCFWRITLMCIIDEYKKSKNFREFSHRILFLWTCYNDQMDCRQSYKIVHSLSFLPHRRRTSKKLTNDILK